MFSIFYRTWWKKNPEYPDGREPCAGKKHYFATASTESQARIICKSWNDTHDPGPLSCKAEYEETIRKGRKR